MGLQGLERIRTPQRSDTGALTLVVLHSAAWRWCLSKSGCAFSLCEEEAQLGALDLSADADSSLASYLVGSIAGR
ncbi:hypothetical protein LNQ52_30560 [Klebsiella pneumoniae subsp. pneumoniae]|nr:hypothetical protein [Klebsiella pneumoniae subsp. pneumoniae]